MNQESLAITEFLPLIATAVALALGSAARPLAPRLAIGLVGLAPLLMCLSLLDREPGAGQRWLVYFILAPVMVLITSELIWRTAWPRERTVFACAEILLVALANLVLIPPLFFPDVASGPGARWIAWSLAWPIGLIAILFLSRSIVRRGEDG